MGGEAILLIGHGSREAAGNEEFLQFAQSVEPHFGGRLVQPCFVELAQPLIATALDSLAQKGTREVTALPVLLFASGHATREIPELLKKASERHPSLKIHYGSPLGVDLRLLEVLEERLLSVSGNLKIPPAETALLFIGRGSGTAEANGDLFKIARLFWERHKEYRFLEICFIGITTPTLQEGLNRLVTLGAKRILMIPYLLFTGTLMKRIHDMRDTYALQNLECEFHLIPHLGQHPRLFEILEERFEEARKNGCLT